MKIKEQYRCASCNKIISKNRYYCYACWLELEQKAGEEE